MHPEERERIEDVKQWAEDLLTKEGSLLVRMTNDINVPNKWDISPSQCLDILVSGERLFYFAPDRGLRVVQGVEVTSMSVYPLSWIPNQAGYSLSESHQAAIYSVLKAWRKEQEGA